MLRGSLRALLLFDIAEELDLPHLHRVLGTDPGKREPAFRHQTPQYVRFERTPVDEFIGQCADYAGNPLFGRVRYFEYGVASVELQLPFAASWPELVSLANQWISSPELERRARKALEDRLPQFQAAVCKPYGNWIWEDYYIVQLDPIAEPDGSIVRAETLVRNFRTQISQIVRGESTPLSFAEEQEVLQASMSYYPIDLLVVGWVAAFVYDSAESAELTIDLLEYANTQLLEFRYYDEVLTNVLSDVYKRLETRRGTWRRWRLASEAEDLNTIRLDYRELAERTENAIKFLSDMFYARTYR
ncbi:MAG TPA: hypothetical protein VHZ55_13360, partial [Bryobacteraceae bacterium]|nr:hypothetical protein [Bryobacteraceae bacterium]